MSLTGGGDAPEGDNDAGLVPTVEPPLPLVSSPVQSPLPPAAPLPTPAAPPTAPLSASTAPLSTPAEEAPINEAERVLAGRLEELVR